MYIYIYIIRHYTLDFMSVNISKNVFFLSESVKMNIFSLSVSLNVYIYIYIYIYTHTHTLITYLNVSIE